MRCSWPHWRETTRKGERVIVSPDGARVYYGTAKEVRDAALLPRRRTELANKLRECQRIARKYDYTPEELADDIRKERREAISSADGDAKFVLHAVPMTEADALLLNAGARLLGQPSVRAVPEPGGFVHRRKLRRRGRCAAGAGAAGGTVPGGGRILGLPGGRGDGRPGRRDPAGLPARCGRREDRDRRLGVRKPAGAGEGHALLSGNGAV